MSTVGTSTQQLHPESVNHHQPPTILQSCQTGVELRWSNLICWNAACKGQKGKPSKDCRKDIRPSNNPWNQNSQLQCTTYQINQVNQQWPRCGQGAMQTRVQQLEQSHLRLLTHAVTHESIDTKQPKPQLQRKHFCLPINKNTIYFQKQRIKPNVEKSGIHTRKCMCPAERENSNWTIRLKAQLEPII